MISAPCGVFLVLVVLLFGQFSVFLSVKGDFSFYRDFPSLFREKSPSFPLVGFYFIQCELNFAT